MSDNTAMEALDLWRRVTVESVRGAGPDLSARQMAVLFTVYLTPPPHTVRGLSRDFRVAKPAITRAIDRLEGYGLLRRKTDDTDRRSILLQRTVAGSVFLSDFADLIAEAAGQMDQ